VGGPTPIYSPYEIFIGGHPVTNITVLGSGFGPLTTNRELRRQGRPDAFKLVFFNPSKRPGQRLGHKMVRFEADKGVTEGGEFPSDLILFMPGLTGPAWPDNADLPLSPGGMIAANAFCQVPDRPGVWVVGDSGGFPGPDWLPKQAHQADLQAKAAARDIAAVMGGREPDTRFKAELVCIVNMLDKAMLVHRSEAFGFLGPRMRLFHWMKRAFETHYPRAYR
jgi:sulfide:quinone oxidoreductase